MVLAKPLRALSLVAILVGAGSAGACSRNEPPGIPAPPAPAMPQDWKLLNDSELPRDKISGFEYKLEGKIKSVRTTLYEVNGRHVQLNTIEPQDSVEADKMYRILANKKAPYSYLRKGDLLYEFYAGQDAVEEVKKGRAALGP
jgi:hypothetical protein